MAIAVATILQESNTFSPVMTRYEDLDPVFGDAVLARHRGKLTETGGFLSVLESAGKEAVPICAAWAVTANRLVRADFERLLQEFGEQLAAAGPVDALLMSMHGAQTAEGVDDVEGAFLARAREILGLDVPVALTLDLHANVTLAMVEHADIVAGYHTYPHVDMFEAGSRAARLILDMLAGRLRPTTAYRKLPLIVPAENMQTTSGPMGRLIEAAKRLEAGGSAVAVSVFGVQPWMDIDEMGCSVIVVSNSDQAAADRYADELAQQFWDNRAEFDVELVPVKQAIEQALAIEGGPVVLSESSDSTGSGSPGDSTGLLRDLLDAQLAEPAAIFLVDSEAVAEAHRVGVGERLQMEIGGKLDRVNSRPVAVDAEVRMLSDGRWTPRSRGYNPGIETSMGRAAVLAVGALRILVAERATMTVDPELFRSHGLDPAWLKIVVVKSPNGFRAAYEPIAKKMLVVDTPGVSTANLRSIPFRRVPRPIYPLDVDFSYSSESSAKLGRKAAQAHP